MRRMLLLCPLLLLSIAPVFAEDITYTTLGASRVRAEANTTSAIIARLPGNTAITWLENVDGSRVGRSIIWYRVTLADGKEGYIHSSLLREGAPTVAAATTTTNTTNTGVTSLTVQSTPAPNSPIPPAASNMCNGRNDLNCGDFAGSSDATAHLQQCGFDEDGLDRDNDGVACE